MPVPPPSLSSDQLVELLDLLKKVDTVELKLTVPADAGRRIMESLGIDPSRRRSARSCSSTRLTSRSTRRASWCEPGVCK